MIESKEADLFEKNERDKKRNSQEDDHQVVGETKDNANPEIPVFPDNPVLNTASAIEDSFELSDISNCINAQESEKPRQPSDFVLKMRNLLSAQSARLKEELEVPSKIRQCAKEIEESLQEGKLKKAQAIFQNMPSAGMDEELILCRAKAMHALIVSLLDDSAFDSAKPLFDELIKLGISEPLRLVCVETILAMLAYYAKIGEEKEAYQLYKSLSIYGRNESFQALHVRAVTLMIKLCVKTNNIRLAQILYESFYADRSCSISSIEQAKSSLYLSRLQMTGQILYHISPELEAGTLSLVEENVEVRQEFAGIVQEWFFYFAEKKYFSALQTSLDILNKLSPERNACELAKRFSSIAKVCAKKGFFGEAKKYIKEIEALEKNEEINLILHKTSLSVAASFAANDNLPEANFNYQKVPPYQAGEAFLPERMLAVEAIVKAFIRDLQIENAYRFLNDLFNIKEKSQEFSERFSMVLYFAINAFVEKTKPLKIKPCDIDVDNFALLLFEKLKSFPDSENNRLMRFKSAVSIVDLMSAALPFSNLPRQKNILDFFSRKKTSQQFELISEIFLSAYHQSLNSPCEPDRLKLCAAMIRAYGRVGLSEDAKTLYSKTMQELPAPLDSEKFKLMSEMVGAYAFSLRFDEANKLIEEMEKSNEKTNTLFDEAKSHLYMIAGYVHSMNFALAQSHYEKMRSMNQSTLLQALLDEGFSLLYPS